MSHDFIFEQVHQRPFLLLLTMASIGEMMAFGCCPRDVPGFHPIFCNICIPLFSPPIGAASSPTMVPGLGLACSFLSEEGEPLSAINGDFGGNVFLFPNDFQSLLCGTSLAYFMACLACSNSLSNLLKLLGSLLFSVFMILTYLLSSLPTLFVFIWYTWASSWTNFLATAGIGSSSSESMSLGSLRNALMDLFISLKLMSVGVSKISGLMLHTDLDGFRGSFAHRFTWQWWWSGWWVGAVWMKPFILFNKFHDIHWFINTWSLFIQCCKVIIILKVMFIIRIQLQHLPSILILHGGSDGEWGGGWGWTDHANIFVLATATVVMKRIATTTKGWIQY